VALYTDPEEIYLMKKTGDVIMYDATKKQEKVKISNVIKVGKDQSYLVSMLCPKNCSRSALPILYIAGLLVAKIVRFPPLSVLNRGLQLLPLPRICIITSLVNCP
jgi:hypothetical protein